MDFEKFMRDYLYRTRSENKVTLRIKKVLQYKFSKYIIMLEYLTKN